MGNIESTNDIWDHTLEPGRASYYRDDYDYYRNQDLESERTPTRTPTRTPHRTPARTPARTAPPSPSPLTVVKEKLKGKEVADEEVRPSPALEVSIPALETSIPAQIAEEIVSEPSETVHVQLPFDDAAPTMTNDLKISKIQKSKPPSPEIARKSADTATPVVMKEYHRHFSLRDLPWAILFVLHMLGTAAGIIFLNVVYLRDMTEQKLHNLQRWFPQLVVALVIGLLLAFLCQMLFRAHPIIMVRSILWVSSILTFGAAVMLISTSVSANIGVGVIFLIFSICQSLYACWVNRRLRFAAHLLAFSLNGTKNIRGIHLISMGVLLMASVWVVFWSFGVVSALTFQMAPIVVLALLAHLAWTMETLRNVVCTSTARSVAPLFLRGDTHSHWDRVLSSAFKSWLGSICLGSFVVPVLHFLHVMGRGVNGIHGDNELMFSCADCFHNVTYKLYMYANSWAYVQVALHGKPFMEASKDTFNLFISKQLDILIERDLTSSISLLSGVSGGMICVLLVGGWTFGTHKALVSSVSVVSFFIGYFLVRITMGVPQGAVCAHYVCYAEDASSPELASSPIREQLKELLADFDSEVAKHA